MRPSTQDSGLLMLLLPSLVAGAAITDTKAAVTNSKLNTLDSAAAVIDAKNVADTKSLTFTGSTGYNKELSGGKDTLGAGSIAVTTTTSASSAATDAAGKIAASRADDKTPIDGKDGKPRNGPWVETTDSKKEKESGTKKVSSDTSTTVIDGKKIPESNDGVMDDKNRDAPKVGTTGNTGGVSEKDKARKQEEGKTGEKAKGNPEKPKEAPPLPHSEEEKIAKEKGQPIEKPTTQKGGIINDNTGLEVPEDLPEKIHDKPNPVPNSAHKDHLDVSKSKHGSTSGALPVEEEGNFHAFVLSFTMIMFAEIGDKTFLVAALMAMKHDRMIVFSAAFSALLVMTILSAILGHTVPVILPKKLTAFLAAMLFFAFGVKLLREGMAMSQGEGIAEEMHEVERELAEKEKDGSLDSLEMGLGGGPRKGRFHRSPSTSPTRGGSKSALSGFSNLAGLIFSPIWVQTFVMTFLGEWGDRSQIATVAMAAGPDYWYVTIGALFGHCICTGIAVLGGRAIAGKVSMKVVTIGGAITFLIFGIMYLYEAMSSA